MANLGSNFYPKLVQISNELGMKPEDLLAVMTSESGINPSAYESKYHGAGLLGFMPDTLKGLGFKGSWQDFINLAGEDQLDYVKKLVQNNMSVNGGKPFTSAAKYYTANLWPIALKLPGIQADDPNTAFIEEHPETITDPASGKQYSKKYYELGYHISPGYESAAYKANPLFHGSVQGAITYGDMMKQVEKNKTNPIYQKAVAQMKEQSGYEPNNTEVAANEPEDDVSKIQSLLSTFISSLGNTLKQHLVIKIGANDFWNAMECARILCLALDEELNINGTIHTNCDSIDIECRTSINPIFIERLCNKVSIMFQKSILKVANEQININIVSNIHSNYQECSIKLAELSYDVFHHQFRDTK